MENNQTVPIIGSAKTVELNNLVEEVKCGWCGNKGKEGMLLLNYHSFSDTQDYTGFIHKSCYQEFQG